ncbi:MAG: hypothetical protein ABSG43_17810 [Solirubrobacteraceae bacterium]
MFFECTLKPHPECAGKQPMLCDDDSRFVLPLRQDTQLYQALEVQTFQYERVHRFARQRNDSGADNPTLRPKRKGVGWQQLRADATVLSDWVKACFHQGWLPIPGLIQRNHRDPVSISGKPELEGFTEHRRKLQLHRPYGCRARRLGLGPARLKQPDGVTLAEPDVTQSAPTDGQRKGSGGKPRRLTSLPDALPVLPDWAAEQEAAERKRRRMEQRDADAESPETKAAADADADAGQGRPASRERRGR